MKKRFTTTFRGVQVEVELIAEMDDASSIDVTARFWKDGAPHVVDNPTRNEMAALCREAGLRSMQ